MNDEKHIRLQSSRVVEADIARYIRAEAKAMAAPPDVRRMAKFTVTFRLQNRIDRAAYLRHRRSLHGGCDTLLHRLDDQLIPALQRRAWRSHHSRAANLRHLPFIARCDFSQNDVAGLEPAPARWLHRSIMRSGAQHEKVILCAERLHIRL